MDNVKYLSDHSNKIFMSSFTIACNQTKLKAIGRSISQLRNYYYVLSLHVDFPEIKIC